MTNPYIESRERAKSQTVKILELLRANKKGVTNSQMQKISLRYSAIVGKMRRDGFDILVENLGDGLCKYHLVSEPEIITINKKKLTAKEILLDKVKNEFGGHITSEQLVTLMSELNLTMMRKQRKLKG